MSKLFRDKDVKVSFNAVGRVVLKSSETREYLREFVKDIQERCGEGYNSDVKYMGTRIIASVYTETPEALQDNLDNNTLLKASRV